MKKHTLYRLIGILLILLPFFGLYQYMKDILYVVFGIALLVTAVNRSVTRTPSAHKKKETERVSPVVTTVPPTRRDIGINQPM